MRREIGQHPGGRAVALADHRDQLDDRAERQFAAPDPPRLQHAEQPGAVQILDRLVGQTAQFLGLAGALAQYRHERFGARQQLGEIRRAARVFRLAVGHRAPLSPPADAGTPQRRRSFSANVCARAICLRRAAHHRVAPRSAPAVIVRAHRDDSVEEIEMIYMVEMDFPHPERLPEWHAWYMAHIRVLLTVPGFRASQRFEAITPTPSPYLALHEVASAGDVRERRLPRAAAARPRPANGSICRPTGTATCSTGSTRRPMCRPTHSCSCCATRTTPAFRGQPDFAGCAASVSTARSANAASPSSRTPRRLSRSHAATRG